MDHSHGKIFSSMTQTSISATDHGKEMKQYKERDRDEKEMH